MTLTWTLVSVGVGWATLCLLLADFFRGSSARVRQRIRVATRESRSATETGSALFSDWRLSGDAPPGLAHWLRMQLAQSGLSLQLAHVTAASGGAAVVGLAIGWLIAPAWAALPALLGAATPWLFVQGVRQRRIARLRRELPEAFDLMRRAVEAGQTVASAFQQAASQSQSALAAEFQRCAEQQNLGLSQDAALRELARRVPIVELNIFVIALLLQRQCGGSPVEVLSNMSALIRKRLRLDQRVQALTAEGRLQAIVLTVLPIATFLGLVAFRPDYVDPLLKRPQLLGLLAAWQVVGAIWVRRTIRLEY